jgi:Caspase domain/PEGA domain
MRDYRHIQRTISVVLVVWLSSLGAAQTNRNVVPVTPNTPRISAAGNYYAIVIGINSYPPPLPALVTAVNDAKAVASVLSANYGFHITLLLDKEATRVNIIDAINGFRDTLNENDSLLIYYAGHGFSDHLTDNKADDKAYWLPVDANSRYSSNRIIADELTASIKAQSARHVLIISDSCFSGGLARSGDIPIESAGRAVFLNRMSRSRSRTLMASGGDEPVSDGGSDGHSVFAYAVLRALERSTQPVFTASDLFYGSVRQQVAGKSRQLPEYSLIRDSSHDDGDFIFVRKGAVFSAPPPMDPSPQVDRNATVEVSAESYVVLRAPSGAEIYIDQQPSGHSTGVPLRLEIQPGQRVIEAFLSGYLPWKYVLSVERGKEVELTADLKAELRADHTSISAEDMSQIRQLLLRYQSAINSRDIKQVKAVWPEIPPRNVEQLKMLPKGARVTLTVGTATLIDGTENAIIRCRQNYEIDGKSQEDNVTFYLGRLAGSWIINQIPSSN